MSSANPNDLVSAFYDREAASAEETAARALVQGAPEAARELKDYKRLSRLIQELPQLAAAPEFAAAVMQRAERESLIPLDPVATVSPSTSAASPGPRRRSIWVASAFVAVAAVTLVAVIIKRPSRPASIAVREPTDRGPSSAEPRKVAARTSGTLLARNEEQPAFARAELPADREVNLRRSAAKSLEGAQPSPTVTREKEKLGFAPTVPAPRPPDPASLLGMTKASTIGKSAGNVPAQKSEKASDKGQDLALMLPANLKTAQVGDVVEALQQDGQQVAVVRLTVVNQVEGLDGVQSVLVRNNCRTLQNVDEIKRMRQQFSSDKSAELSKSTVSSAPGDLICVYIEGSPDEMRGVLQDLQTEKKIQEAQITNTISVADLEQFANPAVPANTQSAAILPPLNSPSSDYRVQAAGAGGSRRAVSLPAATVNKIFSAKQSPAAAPEPSSNSAKQAVVAQEPAESVNAAAPTMEYRDQKKSKDRDSSPQRRSLAGQSAPARSQSQSLAKGSPPGLRESKELAAKQKSCQIFFVITDQPLVQATPPPVAGGKPVSRPALNSAKQAVPTNPAPAKAAP
jgi:hypothetical protein